MPQVNCVIETKGRSVLFCPVNEGANLADAVFYAGDKVIARIPLYAIETVPAKEFKKSIRD